VMNREKLAVKKKETNKREWERESGGENVIYRGTQKARVHLQRALATDWVSVRHANGVFTSSATRYGGATYHHNITISPYPMRMVYILHKP
jgi:hypothetical protein